MAPLFREHTLASSHEMRSMGTVVTDTSNSRLAFSTNDGAGVSVVLDGEPGRRYHDIGGMPIFSPDGTRLAYVAFQRTGRRLLRQLFRPVLVVDGAEAAVGGIAQDSLTFSPDSRRIAYAERCAGQQRVVVDGHAGVGFDDIQQWFLGPCPLFSQNSERIAYVGLRKDQLHVVVDGTVSEPFANLVRGSIHFSPDSRRFAYGAGSTQHACAIVDGEAGPRHFDMLAGTPVFSPDSERWAYVAIDGGRSVLLVDRQEEWEAPVIGVPLFSPDSRHVAITSAFGPEDVAVVHDGREGRHYRDIAAQPIFSSSSTTLAYAASNGAGWFVVADSDEGPSYDGLKDIVFSPDGRRLAYAAGREDRWRIVIDGVEGPTYDSTSRPLFSGDSRHVAYTAGKGDHWFLVVDGEESGHYRGFLGRQTYYDGTAGVFRLVALAHDRVVRVEALRAATAGAGTPPVETGPG